MKKTKHTLLTSFLSLLLCFSMLFGTTWAWFTDEVTSKANKIVSGSLKIDLELLDEQSGKWNSLKNDKSPIFDYDNWEPGYTDVKILKVENEGSLALKWVAQFVSESELSILANVIDVYVCPSATELSYPASRSLVNYNKVGTVAEFVNTIEQTTYGTLDAKEVAYLGIALKMQDGAGNEYQKMSLGGAFDILILATQWTSESDSFNNQYDKDATYPTVTNNLTIKTNVSDKVQGGKLTSDVAFNDDASGINVIVPSGTSVNSNTLTLKIEEDDVSPNVTLKTTVGYNVEVEGVADDNTEVILVTIPKMLPAGQTVVQLFHDGVQMQREMALADVGADEFIYSEATGDVTFGLTHFSNVSAASADSEQLGVQVNGVDFTGTVVSLNGLTERKIIPADGNVYILTYTPNQFEDDGTTPKRYPYAPSGTHYGSYNLNPGGYSEHGVIVEVGATVILYNASIRTNGYTDAIQVGYEKGEGSNNSGTRTNILVADGSYNCLVGQSGIGFGYYTGADVYIEGGGALYAVARRNACPAIGTADQTDGGATSYAPSGPKVNINVGWLVAMPGKGAAGIGGGFKENKNWSGLSSITINGGKMQVYAGADATAIGGGKVGECGDIVLNGGEIWLFHPAANSSGHPMGGGGLGGGCYGIFTSNDVIVHYGEGMDESKNVAYKFVDGITPIEDFVITAPDNTVYTEGATLDSIDKTGFSAKLVLKDGTEVNVTDKVTLSGTLDAEANISTITVTVKGICKNGALVDTYNYCHKATFEMYNETQTAEVNTLEKLIEAIESENINNIVITGNFTIDESISIPAGTTIDGNGKTLNLGSGAVITANGVTLKDINATTNGEATINITGDTTISGCTVTNTNPNDDGYDLPGWMGGGHFISSPTDVKAAIIVDNGANVFLENTTVEAFGENAHVRMVDGSLQVGENVSFMHYAAEGDTEPDYDGAIIIDTKAEPYQTTVTSDRNPVQIWNGTAWVNVHEITTVGEIGSNLNGWKYEAARNGDVQYPIYYSGSASPSSFLNICVTGDTLVTLADGSQKAVKDVTASDQLLVWNFFEGKFDVAPAYLIVNHGEGSYRVITLSFSDGTQIEIIGNHGFFDCSSKEFVLIDEDNVASYVGHTFAKTSGDNFSEVELVSFTVEQKVTTSYSLVTNKYINFITADLLSLTGMPTDNVFNYFEVGSDMKYDQAKMQEDIETYGLYTFEDFEPYGATEEQFNALNAQYLKIAVGKGYCTFEDIIFLFNVYVNK